MRVLRLTGLFMMFMAVTMATTCTRDELCTEEFRTVSIEVLGGVLDAHYTWVPSTDDTLLGDRLVFEGRSLYVVVDDNHRLLLEGRTDTLRFRGFIGGTLVVDEPFVISADGCHINYHSGRQRVQL